MGGLSSIFGGGEQSSQQGVWGLQAPYLQALYQMAFGQTGMQTGMPGPTNSSGAPDPQPIRPIPSPGHSGKGAIKQWENEMRAWQARNPGGAQQGGAGGTASWNSSGGNPNAPGGVQAGGGTPGNPLGPIGAYSANLANGLFQQAQGQSPYLQQQIGNLGTNIAQFWNQSILPGIASEAGMYGQAGGGRQGIAQGMGAQQALQSFTQGATDLYANNWNTGANRANSLYNLGMAPYSAQFAPLAALGGILGGPAVLGSSSGSSQNGVIGPISGGYLSGPGGGFGIGF